jgi:predicted ATPase
MAFCDAAFDVSEAYIQSVLRNSRCVDDMVPAYCTQVALFSATERVATAVDTGIYVLTKIGEDLPAKPTKSTLLRETLKVQRLLKGKRDEQLLRLPMMTNLQKMNAMRVLTQLLLHTIYGRVEMHALVGLRMMQLTLQFGHSVMSGIAFGVYATMLASRQHLKEGQRFANFCLQVRKLHGTMEYLPRGTVMGWRCLGLHPTRIAYHLFSKRT